VYNIKKNVTKRLVFAVLRENKIFILFF